ncbi:MAG: hypothetical protein A2X86_09085 [Bdellovibrionales bacterium GWA2_49_15]|nr:MAG: hypothetical protein A2X86_09085 [Bdellovibrionales bacterium GWA2_49_15]HAZ12931.1 hypothetical protein [Bdellovibrionales bacterium]
MLVFCLEELSFIYQNVAMKIAIVGTGLLGMQAALFFHAMDCHVILLGAENERPLGGELARLGAFCPELVSNDPDCQQTYAELAHMCKNLGQKCEELGLLIRGRVTLIRKCTLTLAGPLIGDARMRDLFRLHYRRSTYESFVDADVVIDARGPGRPCGLSLDGARALGESDIKSSKLIYGIPGPEQWQEIERDLPNMPDPIRVLICGSGETSACLFLRWVQVLKNSSKALSLVVLSDEQKFYGQLKQDEYFRPKLEAAINWGHENYQNAYAKYGQDLKAWEALEDYVQAKVPKPVPPRFQIEFIGEAHVQAIDAPVDRKDLFLTYDTVRWDHGELINKGPFTIGADLVFVATKRFPAQDCSVILLPDEPGHYHLRASPPLKNGLLNIELIKRDLSRFFHRA